ncbi:Uncharacterised protein [Bordetella pertussis]|nr:Uncharacterised protein [Bordetella pertussis]CFW29961.1 Uncharacterised protein [Bordetella pertussis]
MRPLNIGTGASTTATWYWKARKPSIDTRSSGSSMPRSLARDSLATS